MKLRRRIARWLAQPMRRELALEGLHADISRRLEALNARLHSLHEQTCHEITCLQQIVASRPAATFLGDRILTMTHHGHVIYLMPQDTDLTPSILLSGWWEPHVENALVSLLQPGNIAIDVGCNIGYHTLVIASAVGPNGRVYAFEPNPLLQPLLYATLHGNRFPWVSVIAKAALDRDGEVELATDPSHYGSGCIVVGPESDYGPKFSIRADVPATIIDEELNGVDHVDLIHLDIEGAEPLALRGAAKLIERSPTVKIVAEWAVGMMNVRADVQDFVKWLADRGFSLQVIEPSGKFTPVSYEETLYLPECDVLLTR